jgi:hypothetical protein
LAAENGPPALSSIAAIDSHASIATMTVIQTCHYY